MLLTYYAWPTKIRKWFIDGSDEESFSLDPQMSEDRKLSQCGMEMHGAACSTYEAREAFDDIVHRLSIG